MYLLARYIFHLANALHHQDLCYHKIYCARDTFDTLGGFLLKKGQLYRISKFHACNGQQQQLFLVLLNLFLNYRQSQSKAIGRPQLLKELNSISLLSRIGLLSLFHYQIHAQIKEIPLTQMTHSVGFYPKYCHFCPAFRDKIDESFLRFLNLTLVLLDLNSTTRCLVWENERNH